MIWLLYQQWMEQFDDVRVLDLHAADGDIVTNWICQMLPSNTTCGILQSNNNRPLRHDNDTPVIFPKHRQSSSLHVHRIVSHVRQSMIQSGTLVVERPKEFSKQEMTRLFPAITQALEQEGILIDNPCNSSYYDCITKSTEALLLNVSLTNLQLLNQLRGIVLSEEELTNAVNDHNIVYEKAKSSGKYCDINPRKVLANFPSIESNIQLLLQTVQHGSPSISCQRK